MVIKKKIWSSKKNMVIKKKYGHQKKIWSSKKNMIIKKKIWSSKKNNGHQMTKFVYRARLLNKNMFIIIYKYDFALIN